MTNSKCEFNYIATHYLRVPGIMGCSLQLPRCFLPNWMTKLLSRLDRVIPSLNIVLLAAVAFKQWWKKIKQCKGTSIKRNRPAVSD